jgi:hypothetical protein
LFAGDAFEESGKGLESRGLATPAGKNKPRDEKAEPRPELAMEQSIRKFRPDMGLSTNLMLAVALVAACSINAFLLLTHL